MIHTRVLELLKNPKNIQSEDLHLLKEEINSFPYIQNIRALHLYGVHLYDRENYQKALSATAAYTTDKKILYQLINGKIQQIKPEIIPELTENQNEIAATVVENESKQDEIPVRNASKSFADHDYEATESLILEKPEIKHLFVEGERNRILFEGEENFLNEVNNETIDIESTLESGVIVTHKPVSNTNELNETDKEEVIIAEELAATPSEITADETSIIPKTQVEEITDNSELNLEEILPESDFNETKKVEEAPKSEIVIDEAKIASEKVVEKVDNENETSFQTVESFTTETEKPIEDTIQSASKPEQITEVLNPELIIDEEKIETEQVAEKINNDAELSFHGTDSFLPEVKIQSNNNSEILPSKTPKPNVNKHEDEMRRLIEEVEKRMKAKKETAPEKTEVNDEEINHDISFAETQEFHVGEEQKVAEEVVVKTAESIVEDDLEDKQSEENIEPSEVKPDTEVVVSAWKPMNFETSRPDCLPDKPVEMLQSKEEIEIVEEAPKSETPVQEEIDTPGKNISGNLEKTEVSPEEQNSEAPVMNVSFFGSDIASLGLSYKSDQKEKADAKEEEKKIAQQKIDDSNVPGFINTWQSWLKIDRAEETPVDKTESKNKVIESFIENNPRISQLKDEVNFVVKEKTDDISHLMTETLANLYIEQKLYSKAVNAFLVLANKHPDRKEYFEEKIKEIKDNRGKS